ncbi:hypothetical protein QYF36_009060 [Acer negundo]|nr:hypothetical protein QYF36_009060 [Acer negundo]
MSVDQKWQGGPSVGGSTDRSTGGGNNESEEWSVLIDRNAESGHQIFSEEEKKQLDSMAKALVEEAKAGQADDAKPKIQRLLQLIMRSTSKEEDFLESINKFIFYYIKAPEQTYKRNDKIMKDNHVHLLDLIRKILIDQPLQKNKRPNLTETDKKSKYWHSFRNIEELKAAGIKLKPTETSAILSVFSFHSMENYWAFLSNGPEQPIPYPWQRHYHAETQMLYYINQMDGTLVFDFRTRMNLGGSLFYNCTYLNVITASSCPHFSQLRVQVQAQANNPDSFILIPITCYGSRRGFLVLSELFIRCPLCDLFRSTRRFF